MNSMSTAADPNLATNPFLRHWSQPIAYDQLNVAVIDQATLWVIDQIEELKTQIVGAPPGDKDGRLLKRDDLLNQLDRVLSPLYLLAETHPDDEIRTACQASVERLFLINNQLRLDEALFQSLDEFQRNQPSDLTPVEARFLKKSMDDYLRDGFQLDALQREALKQIDDQISKMELQFQNNISACDDFILLDESQMDGLPDDFREAHRLPDGHYKITTQSPSYTPFMKLACDEDARKRLYMTYLNRAWEKNVPLLDQILRYRNQRVGLLGFQTYAHYKLADVMAKDPGQVWHFIEDIAGKVAVKADEDYRELCAFAGVDRLDPWNKSFITRQYLETHFKLDDQEIKQYFPLDNVLNGLFRLAQILYGINVHASSSLPVWHQSVLAFEVRDEDHLIGRFYLDLHPRANKYSHAACFGLQAGKATASGYQLPEAALVCNFTKPTATRPSLLTHAEVETLFHEFGHLMHQLLTTAPLAVFAGTNVARDFVEMPSQIMEHWVWEPTALKGLSAHYETGAPLPDDLVARMLAVKQLNSGLDTQQQLFYGALDMTCHNGFLPSGDEDTTHLVARLQEKYTRFPALAGTHFQASFGHLIGYAAGYYGYLWSRVYADDMFSVFKKAGIFDPRVGRRFREEILARGDTEEPMALIEQFLGRPPRTEAFLENLGLVKVP